jgi:aconitate hydratase
LAQSYGRIHRQNLVNFGVIPLSFTDSDDYESIEEDDELAIEDPVGELESGREVEVHNTTRNRTYRLQHELSRRQIDVIRAGSLINRIRDEDR